MQNLIFEDPDIQPVSKNVSELLLKDLLNKKEHILVIDDLRSFRNEIRRQHPDWDVTYACNERDTREILEYTGLDYFDQIWFDHDLGLMDGSASTTIKIAEEFEKLFYDDQPYNAKLYVHSSNSVGSEKLMQILRHYNPTRVTASDYFIVKDNEKQQIESRIQFD